MMGTVATALRAYVAETDKNIPDLSLLGDGDNPLFQNSLGFRDGDLDGTYFTQTNFQVFSGVYTSADNSLEFLIQGDRDELASGIQKPGGYTLDQDGLFTATGL